MVVVLQWYYDERYGKVIIPEISGVFGSFNDHETANSWIETANTWGGWGKYDYQVKDLYKPNEE